jgi:diguanylate cyclase (GGDEF)-like protein/PAS domain S-box-containing protein
MPEVVHFDQEAFSMPMMNNEEKTEAQLLDEIIDLRERLSVLETQEERYKKLVGAVTDYIYIVQIEHGRPVRTMHGPGCFAVTGYTSEEYDADPLLWIKMVDEKDRNAVIEQAGRVLSGETVHPLEHRILHKDGSVRWVRNTPVARSEHNRLVAYDGLIVDVTESKKAEEQIIRQKGELERINRELSILYEVSMAVSRTIDLDKLFSDIMQAITGLEFLNVELKGVIFLVEGDAMHAAYGRGIDSSFLDNHKGLKVGSCLCGLAAKTGEVILSRNSSTDGRHMVLDSDMKPHGHIILPLKVKDSVIGVLCLYLPRDAEIDENKVKMLVSICNQIGIAVENARLYEEAKSLSLHDSLTGFGNRRYMEVMFEKIFAESKRYGRHLSAIMLDIDYFKKYNDTFGHIAGDSLLARLAAIISREIRETDLAIRYGGEEFLILLPETEIERALEVTERIRRSVEAGGEITVSLGISTYDNRMEKKEDLICAADEALYRAKREGRNRIIFLGDP